MRVLPDDEVYDVDSSYLGPPGRYLGRFRYRTLILFPAVFVPAVVALYWLGAPMNFLTIGLPFLVVLRLVQVTGGYFTKQTPFFAVLAQLFGEVHAPRGETTKSSQPVSTRTATRWVAGVDQTVLPRPKDRKRPHLRRRETPREFPAVPTLA